MNKLYVGITKTVDLPKGGFLFIDDEVPELPEWKRPRYFDVSKHSFNPLDDVDHKKARELATALYTIAPQGENTLTVRNGKRAMLNALLEAEKLDEVEGDEEVRGMIGDLMTSPVLRQVLCSPTNFTFKETSRNFARINRAELGDFDALVLGLFLISHFPGQVVIPDLGFYGRDIHVSLVRQERLIGGVNFFDELPDKLRQNCLLIDDKELSGASLEDAETVAKYEGYAKGTTGFTDFVKEAIE